MDVRSLVVGTIVGGVAGVFGMSVLKAPENPKAAVPKQQMEGLQTKIRTLEEDGSRLRKELEAARVPPAVQAPIAQATPIAQQEDDRPDNSERRDRRRAEGYRNRLDTMALRIGLTSQQKTYFEQKLNAYLSNPQNNEDFDWRAFEQEMLAQLSYQQKSSYDEYREEQRTAAIEMAASRDMFQLQMELGLTEQQKDAVFQSLADIYLKQRETGRNGNFRGGGGGREFAQRRMEALQKVLTPQQFALYESRMRNRGGGGQGRGN